MTQAAASSVALPAWADTVRQKYLAGEASVFVLYRNVFDRYLTNTLANGTALSLVDFLSGVLLKENKQAIIEFSVDRGVRYLQGSNVDDRQLLYSHLEGKGLGGIFDALERRMREQPSTAIVIPYAGTLFPATEPHFLSMDERAALTALHRWSLDDALAAGDNVVLLITESLAEINPVLLTNPRVAAIELPMPDQAERSAAIRHYAPRMPEAQVARLAGHTAGLRTIQLASIVAGEGPGLSQGERLKLIAQLLAGTPNAAARAEKLADITAGMTPDEIRRLIDPERPPEPDSDPDQEMLAAVRKRKRELIEKECAGLIEFVEPRHGLEVVGGNEHIKSELLAIAQAVRAGDRTRSPMGLLAVGPMGAGKTFVIKAFLKEAGLTGVALKNFRSKWVGATESNLERVLATVKAMGPIALVIDEGDRSFGSGGGDDNDGGTSSRVIARLKEFMSDPENRGQVLFILMTNRPDKLDTDIKRPGRLDRKIPFFYADSAAERAAVVAAILRRYDGGGLEAGALETLCADMEGYSNADLEAVALLALEFAGRAGRGLDAALFAEAVADFIPPQEHDMIRYMELLAVAETSRRSLMPPRFKSMSATDLRAELSALRLKISR
jgi:transitional endoplasmic reticulum ATPase